MTKTWLTVSALAVALGATSGGMAAKAYAASPAPAPAQYQDQGRWDEPPSEYREAQREGYRDGIEAARRDYESRHHRDADDHESYRHPRVERELRDSYRSAFREGYSRAMQHMQSERRDRDHDHDDDRPRF